MGYPASKQRERMKDIKPGTPPSGPAGASSANPKPEPARPGPPCAA